MQTDLARELIPATTPPTNVLHRGRSQTSWKWRGLPESLARWLMFLKRNILTEEKHLPIISTETLRKLLQKKLIFNRRYWVKDLWAFTSKSQQISQKHSLKRCVFTRRVNINWMDWTIISTHQKAWNAHFVFRETRNSSFHYSTVKPREYRDMALFFFISPQGENKGIIYHSGLLNI